MTDPNVRAAPFRSRRRPTWIELDQDALGRNVAAMVGELAGVPLMAVVKAAAYGHGSVAVARTALRHGASWVATATVSEAMELRHDGIAAPILVLGYTPPEQVSAAVAGRLAVTVFDRDVLGALDMAGAEQGRPATAHLKVDTGMTRLGVAWGDLAEFVERAKGLRHVELEGCYTHFRKGADRDATEEQLGRFMKALKSTEATGHHFRLRHAANSAAWQTVPSSRLDLVRSGIEMLGLRTPDGRQREPVLSFRTTVAQIAQNQIRHLRGVRGRLPLRARDADRHPARRIRGRISSRPQELGCCANRGPRAATGRARFHGSEHGGCLRAP